MREVGMRSALASPRRWHLSLLLAAIAGALVTVGCGSSNSSTSSAPGAGTSSSSASASATSTSSGSSGTASTSQCGPKPGVAATGTPIVLGAINTKQPGVDFTDISNMAQAYFNCVNANGGVNGHPIKLSLQTEQTQPPQIAAASKLLVQTNH